jgi:1,4-alpha-glucan branching enzyme
MIKKGPATREGKVQVTFELPPGVQARQIYVVGEFSQWEGAGLPMSQAHPEANWELTLELEPGRRYRFRYLTDDDHWFNDMFADDHAENPYGSYDSVIDLREFAYEMVG